MTKVGIESNFAGCDGEITMIAMQTGKIIDIAEKTSNQRLALSMISERLAELNLELDFSRAGILE